MAISDAARRFGKECDRGLQDGILQRSSAVWARVRTPPGSENSNTFKALLANSRFAAATTCKTPIPLTLEVAATQFACVETP